MQPQTFKLQNGHKSSVNFFFKHYGDIKYKIALIFNGFAHLVTNQHDICG